MTVNCLCTRTSVLHGHHFKHIINIMSVRKLFVIKLAFPKHSHLNSPISKDTGQPNEARLRHKSKSKLNRTDNTKKHPSHPTNNKDNRSSNQVQIGTSTRIKSPKIREKHSWKYNGSKRQPSTFLFIDSINRRNLQLKRIIILIKKERIIRLSCNYIQNS